MTAKGNSKELVTIVNQALVLPMETELQKIESEYRFILAEDGEKEEKRIITTVFATVATIIGGSVTGAIMGVIPPEITIATVILLPIAWPFIAVVCAIPNLLIMELFAKKKRLLKNAYALELGAHLYQEHGITLLGKPEPRRSLRNGSSKDLVYSGKMKEDGRKFEGSVYRNKEGLILEVSGNKAIEAQRSPKRIS